MQVHSSWPCGAAWWVPSACASSRGKTDGESGNWRVASAAHCHTLGNFINTVLLVLLLPYPFHGLFSRTTWVSRFQKGKTSLDLNEAREDGAWDGSGITWTICKQSAARSRQITTPTPHDSIFTGRMLFLMPNQQCQCTEGNSTEGKVI